MGAVKSTKSESRFLFSKTQKSHWVFQKPKKAKEKEKVKDKVKEKDKGLDSLRYLRGAICFGA